MVWLLQLVVGQLLTIGFGKIDAKLRPATHSNHSSATFKLQQVEIVQYLHQLQVTTLMVPIVVHNMTDSVTEAAIVDGAGLLMILLSGLQQMQIAGAKSDWSNLADQLKVILNYELF